MGHWVMTAMSAMCVMGEMAQTRRGEDGEQSITSASVQSTSQFN